MSVEELLQMMGVERENHFLPKIEEFWSLAELFLKQEEIDIPFSPPLASAPSPPLATEPAPTLAAEPTTSCPRSESLSTLANSDNGDYCSECNLKFKNLNKKI